METPLDPDSVEHRIAEALGRISAVVRADEWVRAQSAGLTPTQFSILEHLEGRTGGSGIKAIGAYLSVSQPTATDSVNALERKGLVRKSSSGGDRRAVVVQITDAGKAAVRDGGPERGAIVPAVRHLDPAAREDLLVTLIAVMRHLQQLDAIPVQRMCVSCRHFRPFMHEDPARPHHCAFVDIAFGQRDLRVECRDHDTADPSFQAATWDVFARIVQPSRQN